MLERPLEMFRIGLSPRSVKFFCVCVAATNADMVAAVDRLSVRRKINGRNVIASCIAAASTDPKWKHLVGFLFFSKDALSGALVAHEIAHAGFRALEHYGVRLKHWRNVGKGAAEPSARFANDAEERYADIVEHMTRTFWREAYARGLAVPG